MVDTCPNVHKHNISKHTKFYSQLYFFFLNVSLSISDGVPLSSFFGFIAISQIVLFFFEIYTSIYIYNQLKISADECGTIIHGIGIVETDRRLSLNVCLT